MNVLSACLVHSGDILAMFPKIPRERIVNSQTYWCVLNVGLLDGLLGVAAMIINSYCGSFPKISGTD